jgi:Fic family protein
MPFSPNYTITVAIAQNLVAIETGKKQFESIPMNAMLLSSLRKSARLASTHYSTQIEGNRLTMEQVTDVVSKKAEGFPGRERDEKEVVNYYKALEYLETKNNKPLTETTIQTIHGWVLSGRKSASAYREGQNVIKDGLSGAIVYMPPEASEVSGLMKALVSWIDISLKKGKIPVPIIAALAHYQFATIHPYYDGNGRTARLITNYILHYGGYGLKGIYSLEAYYAKNLQGYYDALAVEDIPNYYMGRAEADLTNFLEYFMKGMAISFTNIVASSKENSSPSLQDNSKTLRELSAKQRMALDLFVNQKEITNTDLAQHLGISKRSAATLLKKWLENEFLIIGNPSNRARSYRLNHKWEQLF